MNAAATTFAKPPPTEIRRRALLFLLADEDPSVFERVREEIVAHGHAATAWLKPATVDRDPLLRRRAQHIVQQLERREADGEFLGFCLRHGEDFDLEDALWLLARTRYAGINGDAYRALLDSYAATLRERLLRVPDVESTVAVINEFLFRELGFHGNTQDFYDPENSYLNRVLDRRTGNPISLSLVYMLLARRLHLPITGVAMPEVFICRFQSPAEEARYIDPFNGGKILTRADCVAYLVKSQYGYSESHLAPATPRRILARLCANLHQIYRQLERRAEAERFQRYLVALARS